MSTRVVRRFRWPGPAALMVVAPVLVAVLVLIGVLGVQALVPARGAGDTTATGLGFDPHVTAAEVAACSQAATHLPPPDGKDPATVTARYPASPFQVPLWSPPYPAAERAARDARARGDWGRAGRLHRLTAVPRGVWFADPAVSASTLTAAVAQVVGAAAAKGQVPVLVVYAIPLRDCGGDSAGGARSAAAYRSWITAFAAGLTRSGGRAAVIVEPDALGLLNRLPADRQAERLGLLRTAVMKLSAVPAAAVYLDAGHSNWVPVDQMRQRLTAAGIAGARGFALNVANFRATDQETGYGDQLAAAVGGRHYVVDTSRNGLGPTADDRWCNPPGRALGPLPQVPGVGAADAYLWVKPPGESDGTCGDGAPVAGTFWPSYADGLALRAGW